MTPRPPLPPAPPPPFSTQLGCGRVGRSVRTPILASEGLDVGVLGLRPSLGPTYNTHGGWCAKLGRGFGPVTRSRCDLAAPPYSQKEVSRVPDCAGHAG